MSLSERLKQRLCPSEQVTIDGERFTVRGLTLNATAAITAKARRKDGSVIGDKLDRLLLEACVFDPEDGTSMPADQWGDVPRSITGPLMTRIISLCGLDKDDIDPKDSDSTGS